jgi:Peptidase S24-like
MNEDHLIRRNNLRLLCESWGMRPGDLRDRVGSSYPFWRDLLTSDAKPFGEKVARRIEEALGLQRGWLDEPQRRSQKNVGREVATTSQTSAVSRTAGSATIAPAAASPVVISMLAGDRSLGRINLAPLEKKVITRMELDEPWLRRSGTFTSTQNLALVTGIGDSMIPTFHDGDVLMVDRGITEIKLDAIYALALNGELYIKRVQRMPDGSVLMLSDNKSYEPYQIRSTERDRFRVIGRVVMVWNARRL